MTRDAMRRLAGYAGAAAVATAALAASSPFGREQVGEIAIFALFALSIGFLGGGAGLVSFGHALFYGVGGYATAYLSVKSGWPTGAAMIAAVSAGTTLAAVVGAFVVRTKGTIFIMVTLAVAMMFYAWVLKSPVFNGPDGLGGIKRVDLRAIGVDLSDPAAFAIAALLFLFLAWFLLDQIVRSPFGRALAGIRQNEARMRALGCPVQSYKLAAFTISGSIAALAGSLSAQHTGLVSPEIAHWILSGDGLIAAIIGGFQIMAGSIAGAALLVVVKHELSSFTQYWFLCLGAGFVVIVLLAPEGIVGRIARSLRPSAARKAPAKPAAGGGRQR